MPQIGERSTDGKGKTFCGWALDCPYEDFTHDPWPTWAQAQAHVDYTEGEGSWGCPEGNGSHRVVEVWKQGRAGVELGGYYPTEVEIADLAAWALTVLNDEQDDLYPSEALAA